MVPPKLPRKKPSFAMQLQDRQLMGRPLPTTERRAKNFKLKEEASQSLTQAKNRRQQLMQRGAPMETILREHRQVEGKRAARDSAEHQYWQSRWGLEEELPQHRPDPPDIFREPMDMARGFRTQELWIRREMPPPISAEDQQRNAAVAQIPHSGHVVTTAELNAAIREAGGPQRLAWDDHYQPVRSWYLEPRIDHQEDLDVDL